MQRRPRIVGRFVPGWQEAEDAGGNAGDRDREHQDDPVDADVVEPRKVLRQDSPQHDDAADRERCADHRAGQRQRERFGERLPHQPAAAGAKRKPHGPFATPGGGSRQQEARDVRTRNQQHQSGGDHQDPDAFGGRPDHVLKQRDQARLPIGISRRLDAALDRGEIVRRLVRRTPWRQAGDGIDVVEELLAGGAIEWQRPPDVHGLALRKAAISSADVLEAGGHDANDGERLSAQADNASDNRAIGAEARPPDRVADDRDSGVGALLRPGERPSDGRAHAEHVEVVARDPQALQPLRPIVDGELEILTREAGDAPQGPGVVPVAHQGVRRHRKRRRVWRGLVHAHQAFRFAIRQRRENNAAEEAENRRGGADADGERPERHRREARVASHGAPCVPQIRAQRVEPGQTALIAVGVLGGIEAAQTLVGRPPGLLG